MTPILPVAFEPIHFFISSQKRRHKNLFVLLLLKVETIVPVSKDSAWCVLLSAVFWTRLAREVTRLWSDLLELRTGV